MRGPAERAHGRCRGLPQPQPTPLQPLQQADTLSRGHSPRRPPHGGGVSLDRPWLAPAPFSIILQWYEREDGGGGRKHVWWGGGELRWGEERCRGSRGGVHWPFRTRMRLARPWHWVGGRQAFAVWVVAGWRVGRMGGGGPASGARRTAGRREAVGGRRARGDTAGEVYKRYPPNACTPSDDQ